MTEIQKRILQAIADAVAETGRAPSVREIAHSVGRSPPTVQKHLARLEAEGHLQRIAGSHRTIRLMGRTNVSP